MNHTYLAIIALAIISIAVAERPVRLEDIERDNLYNERKAAEELRNPNHPRESPREYAKPPVVSNPSVYLKPSTFLTPKQLAEYINQNHIYQQQQQLPQYQTYFQQYQPKKLIYPTKLNTRPVNPAKIAQSLPATKTVPYYIRPMNYPATLSGFSPLLQPLQTSPSQFYSTAPQFTYQQAPLTSPLYQTATVPLQSPVVSLKPAAVPVTAQTANIPVAAPTENVQSPTQYLYIPQAPQVPQVAPTQTQYVAHPMKINGVSYLMLLPSASYVAPQIYNPNLQSLVQAYAPTHTSPLTAAYQQTLSKLSLKPNYQALLQNYQQIAQADAQHSSAPSSSAYVTSEKSQEQTFVQQTESPQQAVTIPQSANVRTRTSPRSLLESYVPSMVQLQYSKHRDISLSEQLRHGEESGRPFSSEQAPSKSEEYSQPDYSQQQEYQIQSSQPEQGFEYVQSDNRPDVKTKDTDSQLYAKYLAHQQKKTILKPKPHHKYVPKTSIQHGDGSHSFVQIGSFA